MYVRMYVCTYVCMHVRTYVYVEAGVCNVPLYTHVYIHIHIYVYTYTYTERERERWRERKGGWRIQCICVLETQNTFPEAFRGSEACYLDSWGGMLLLVVCCHAA